MTDVPLTDQLINGVIDLSRQAGSKYTGIDSPYEKPENPVVFI